MPVSNFLVLYSSISGNGPFLCIIGLERKSRSIYKTTVFSAAIEEISLLLFGALLSLKIHYNYYDFEEHTGRKV